MLPMSATRMALVALVALTTLTACGTPPSDDPDAGVSGRVAVFAPTSLSEVLGKLVAAFKPTHPGVIVTLTYSADSASVGKATAATGAAVLIAEGHAPVAALGGAATGEPVRLAGNQLVIAVAHGNPLGVAAAADLARPGLRVALCAETEPCGTLSATVLAAAGVTVPAPIRVPDVRTARARVESGAADAALVYRTDTRVAEDRVDTIEFGESSAALAGYEAVALANRPDPQATRVFLAFLTSPAAGTVLSDAGFPTP